MSNPFCYDINNELRKPLTKYEALTLAARLTPLLDDFAAKRDKLRYTPEQLERQRDEFFADDARPSDELYLNLLFDFAEQIMEKDADLINELLRSDKQLAVDEYLSSSGS